ncbi:MAG: phosphoribosylformylglycinamidine synthase subunit PurQ [Armatimonadota bacterium]|nr:phosphoribosylformylglycinamidine synthase subunit PurQ [Armatimonadota bacterium]
MRVGVVVFPGSTCDRDCLQVLRQMGASAEEVWHEERELRGLDAVILPGGFSYGDYLRAGAVAARSPVMEAVRSFARSGGAVLGICNGFQILLEAGLLPGALVRNRGGRFVCQTVWVRVESSRTPATRALQPGQVLRLPVAHGDGRYIPPRGLDPRQVVFRYCDEAGRLRRSANPNGSSGHIAGVCNAAGNVVGMMPHPERAADPLLGSADGLRVLAGLWARPVARAPVAAGGRRR